MASPPSSLSSPPMSVLTDVESNDSGDNNNNNSTLNFDNPETLELLLQTITQNLDSPSSSSIPPDWTQMSSSATGGGGDNGGGGWPTTMDPKENSFASFFPMDLDLRDFDTASNMSMSIDPSALHFNTSMFTQSSSHSSSSLSPLPHHEHQAHPYIMTHEDPMSVFALGQPTLSHSLSLFDSLSHSHGHLQPGARRLSVTSSSSSSGASLSPILESRSSPSSASSEYGDPSQPPHSLSQQSHSQPQQSPMQMEAMETMEVVGEVDPAYELAQRVRQSAGVTLAVPVSSQVQLLVAAANQHQQQLSLQQQSSLQHQQLSPSQSNQQYQQAQSQMQVQGQGEPLAHGTKLAIPRMPARPSPPPATSPSTSNLNSPPSSTTSNSPSLASSATNSPSPPPSLSSSSSSSATTPSAGSPSPLLSDSSLTLAYPSATGAAPVDASTTATSATSATVADSALSAATATSGTATTGTGATAASTATATTGTTGNGGGNTTASTPLIGPSGRPKTSHTTIERRYRTNLNARITGLKHAVPALRVLEGKGGGPNQWGDKVDDRGFVDGVKVARKMSKANVLGKATEYIRVLKNRERRLQHEQSGLKSLISGLVGGPALLREWEREWKERFGGEERDEVEGMDKGAGDDDDNDDEGGESEGEDGEEEEGRARKKARVVKVKKEKVEKKAPAPTKTGGQGGVVGQGGGGVGAVGQGMPEKRKRGRPRKVPVPSVGVPPITLQPMEGAIARSQPPSHSQSEQPVLAQQPVQAQGQQQYLLAAFAFFSVLNSPLAASFRGHSQHSHAHHNSNEYGFEQGHGHHGQVLTPLSTPTPSTIVQSVTGEIRGSGWAGQWGTNEYIQAFHLAVSLLVVVYVVFPWVGSVLRRALGGFGGKVKGGRSTQTETHRHLLLAALSPTTRGSPSESAHLRAALGVTTGIVGLLQGVIKAKAVRRDRGLEMNVLEQRAWVRLGELIAFDGSVSRATRLQTYWCMSWHVSTFAPSTTDLTTLALIILPVSPSKATSLWSRARAQDILRPYERLALENLNVEDAADWLAKWQSFHDRERKGGRCGACVKRTPLGVLAAILTRERLRRCAAVLFVRSVVPASTGVNEYGEREEVDEGYAGESDEEREVAREREMDRERDMYDPEVEEREDEERKQTIDAGKSIGGRTAELAVMLERIWNEGFGSPSPSSTTPSSTAADVVTEEIGIGCVEEHDLARSDEVEIRTLLTATEIYRRIFPSSFPSCTSSSRSSYSSHSSATVSALSVILSPPSPPPTPPSQWRKTSSNSNLALTGTLRAALASGAFDFDLGRVKDERLGVALEEARDRVCDMLTEVERSVRRNCGRV